MEWHIELDGTIRPFLPVAHGLIGEAARLLAAALELTVELFDYTTADGIPMRSYRVEGRWGGGRARAGGAAVKRRLLAAAQGARMWWRVVRTNPVTVTVATWRGGALTMPCPDWCAGHPDAGVAQHPADFHHDGEESGLTVVTAAGGSTQILAIGISQSPLSIGRTPLPYLTLDLGTAGCVRFTPDEVRALADGLDGHAAFLRTFAADFEPIRAAAFEAMRPPGIPPHLPPLAPWHGDL